MGGACTWDILASAKQGRNGYHCIGLQHNLTQGLPQFLSREQAALVVLWAARTTPAVVDFYCPCCVRLFIVDGLRMMTADPHKLTRTLDSMDDVRLMLIFQLRTPQPLSHQSVLFFPLMTLLEGFMVLTLVLKGFDQTLCCFKWQSTAKSETHCSFSCALLKRHSRYPVHTGL